MATASASGPGSPLSESEVEELRREHERLSRELVARKSIDEVRRGSYASFFATVAGGLSAKFAWDRWGFGPHRVPVTSKFPFLFALALLLSLACLAVAARAFIRARSLMRVEDRDYARLKWLQEQLGIVP